MSYSSPFCMIVLVIVLLRFCYNSPARNTPSLLDFVPPGRRYATESRHIVNHLEIGVARTYSERTSFSEASPLIRPVDFGADPFGIKDSTDAFHKAVQTLLSRHSDNHTLSDGIWDLGGATLDLEGGDYLISQPIVIPQMYGNLKIVQGTIRATSEFPTDKYLISIGQKVCDNPQRSCNENILISEVMLDCQHVAHGAIYIGATMGAVFGPQNFYLGFTAAGVTIEGGHEVQITYSWFGQYLYSDPRSHDPKYVKTRAIEMLGNDHYVDNTIVYSALIGVYVTGAANLFKGVHTWNMQSQHGGAGILLNTPGYTQNRIDNCYLDGNSVIALAPEHLTITDCFFLCAANVVIKAVPNHQTIQGLTIINNEFDGCKNDTVVLDERDARFLDAYDTVIRDNMISSGYTRKSTHARKQLTQSNAKEWKFDFTDMLLLSDIVSVRYSVELISGFTRHASRLPAGNVVVVETEDSVSGTVFVDVDQSLYNN